MCLVKIGHVVNTHTNTQRSIEIVLFNLPYLVHAIFTYKLIHSSGIIRSLDDSCFTRTRIWMRRHDDVCMYVYMWKCECECRCVRVWRTCVSKDVNNNVYEL